MWFRSSEGLLSPVIQTEIRDAYNQPRQALPPTINLDDPDPECNLCHIPHQARPQSTRIVVSNSLGFGGCNTCLVLRKVA